MIALFPWMLSEFISTSTFCFFLYYIRSRDWCSGIEGLSFLILIPIDIINLLSVSFWKSIFYSFEAFASPIWLFVRIT